jgi:hypothetical protein
MPQAATKLAMQTEPAEALREQITLLAFEIWQQRGCPEGSANEDWLLAENALIGPVDKDSV